MTRAEKETIIRYDEESDFAEVYTCSSTMMRRIDKLRSKTPMIIDVANDGQSATYILPKKWVKVVMPRVLSEEQRQAAAERARAMHNENK